MSSPAAPPNPAQWRVRALGVLTAMVLLAGVVAAVGDDDIEAPADGAIVEVDGRSTVVRVGGQPVALATGDQVRAGDEVIVESGTIVLRLAGGGVLEGRAADEDIDATRVVMGAVPELVAGDLLVVGGNGLDVDAAGTVVALGPSGATENAVRIRRGLSVLTGVYRGAALVESAGQQRSVPALRQIGISSIGRPAANPDPLAYDNADRWDLRYLGAAIDLGIALDRYSRSFTANVGPNGGRTTAGYELLLPRLAGEPEFDAADLAAPRDPGDVLVGAAITVVARDGSFQDRWNSVFEFRDEGAAWGLVALDQGVDEAPVLADVEQALSIASRPPAREVATPPLGPTPTSPPSPPATAGTTATT
ncbi:MAG: hypothetical protein H0W25_03100, partial [Acidimicrobiia bacterium]|nr:hypothetical protein [Acidimicrobiia bacterium]